MPGSKDRRSKKTPKSAGFLTSARWVAPKLPPSGQILGVLVRALGISHPVLQSKNAQRYFSGRLAKRVKESSRAEIIAAISETLASSVFVSAPSVENDNWSNPTWVAAVLKWHAVNWDRIRAFLLPRVIQVASEHLAPVWQPYVRLAAIDIALRVAAQLHISGASADALAFLGWTGADRRGQYLNNKRRVAGVSLMALAEDASVSDSTVEAWLYEGSRPTDQNLAAIARALASNGTDDEFNCSLKELRRLYWTSDVADILSQFIGAATVDEIMGHMRQYSTRLHSIINDKVDPAKRADVLRDLVSLGAHSDFSGAILSALLPDEPDSEWRDDLAAATSDWTRRVLAVNLNMHRSEEDDLIRDSEGRVLQDWDVNNVEAYEHYRRFGELQLQGKIPEAMAELDEAVRLDPLDPVNQFTLGSFKGTLGAKTKNERMVEEGLEACWLAATLDPKWSLPWTEVGFILLEAGKIGEAVEHLRAIDAERSPLDSRYYSALGAGLRDLGYFEESLEAFESALELNPDDPPIVAAAATVATLAGNKRKETRYRRTARHMGASDELDLLMGLAKAYRSAIPRTSDKADGHDREMATLGASIRLNPADADLYFQRARLHFLKKDDDQALADLDQVIKLEPTNFEAYYIKGTIHGYRKQYDQVVADMTEAVRINSTNASAHYLRGLAHGELDMLDLATADLDEAIRLDPDNADAYRGRGDCCRYRREYDLAIADFNAALDIDPENAFAYRGRGAAYRMKGDLERAIADYDEATRLDPRDSFALRFRGDAHLANRDYDKALSDCEAALSISGPDEVSYFYIGNAHMYSGNFKQAIQAFDSAVKQNPKSGRSFHGRALARELAGDSVGKEADYREARELGFHFSD